MTWIKTAEQLPPKDCYVLAVVPNVKGDTTGRNGEKCFAFVKYEEGRFLPFRGLLCGYGVEEVTHWTHLPSPPKE